MSDLSLHFINNELYRVSFSHPALKEQIISYRGKTFENSFQWTPAVKALAVFLLKNAASEEGAKPKLEGTDSSLASSLDYALSKQPQWTFDVFGRDKRGKTLLRKLIRRTNPERKRPGPVILELNQANISAKNIQILSDNKKITEKEKILDLCSKIEKKKISFFAINNNLAENKNKHFEPQHLKQIISSEATDMLWKTDVFNTNKKHTAYYKILTNPSVNTRTKAKLWGIQDENLNTAQRLGMGADPLWIKKMLSPTDPIKVIAPWIEITPLILFEFLKRKKSYNLSIDYEWGYTAEVRRAIDSGDINPDLCVLGIGPAVTAANQTRSIDFNPMMLLPSISHRVLLNNTEETLGHGEYNFLCEEASTPEFCFESMERAGAVSRKKISISHLEPHEAFSSLEEKNPDLKMIMFFPHFSVNQIINNCSVGSIPGLVNNTQESVLFASNSFLANKAQSLAMNIALRNAWLELREKPYLLSTLVSELVEEQRFVQFFKRFTGISSSIN